MASGTTMYHNGSEYSCKSSGAWPREGLQPYSPGPRHHQRKSRRTEITVFEAEDVIVQMRS